MSEEKIKFDSKELEEVFQTKSVAVTLSPRSKTKNVTCLSDKRINQVMIGISKFKSYGIEKIKNAINNLDLNFLNEENLESLLFLVPNEDEINELSKLEEKLNFEDSLVSKTNVDPADLFLLSIYDIPKLREKIENILFTRKFDFFVSDLSEKISFLFSASDSLFLSTPFKKILSIILTITNYISAGIILFIYYLFL